MNREHVEYGWIVEKIGCNLPWSNYKTGIKEWGLEKETKVNP